MPLCGGTGGRVPAPSKTSRFPKQVDVMPRVALVISFYWVFLFCFVLLPNQKSNQKWVQNQETSEQCPLLAKKNKRRSLLIPQWGKFAMVSLFFRRIGPNDFRQSHKPVQKVFPPNKHQTVFSGLSLKNYNNLSQEKPFVDVFYCVKIGIFFNLRKY